MTQHLFSVHDSHFEETKYYLSKCRWTWRNRKL